MGGANHPHLGLFGLMTAKNTAVNIIILTTFLSFLFYRRSGKTPTASWKKVGNVTISVILFLSVISIVVIGIVGFSVPTDLRVNIPYPLPGLNCTCGDGGCHSRRYFYVSQSDDI